MYNFFCWLDPKILLPRSYKVLHDFFGYRCAGGSWLESQTGRSWWKGIHPLWKRVQRHRGNIGTQTMHLWRREVLTQLTYIPLRAFELLDPQIGNFMTQETTLNLIVFLKWFFFQSWLGLEVYVFQRGRFTTTKNTKRPGCQGDAGRNMFSFCLWQSNCSNVVGQRFWGTANFRLGVAQNPGSQWTHLMKGEPYQPSLSHWFSCVMAGSKRIRNDSNLNVFLKWFFFQSWLGSEFYMFWGVRSHQSEANVED